MIDLSTKSALVIDRGLFPDLAVRLSKEFGRVGYCCYSWKRNAPSTDEFSIGKGLDGVEWVKNLWDKIDSYDLLVFPDLLDGDLQVYLRKRGYRVWGSGKAEDLELYRYYSKRILSAVGLSVSPYRIVVGTDALRELLKAREDLYVKVSLLRGLTETFHHESFWLTEQRLLALEWKLGPMRRSAQFLVEDAIETDIEYGFDTLCVDGAIPDVILTTVEWKDCTHVAVLQDVNESPEGVQLVNSKLLPVLAIPEYRYKNFWSCEIRKAKDGTDYPTDLCCRKPSPGGEVEEMMFENLGEQFWFGAEGILVQPRYSARYGITSVIYSEFADENWLGIGIPERYRANVSLYCHCRDKAGHDYVVPLPKTGIENKNNTVGLVTTVGDDLRETIAENQKIAQSITGDKINIRTDKIDDLIHEFESMTKLGMNLEPTSK